MNTKDFTIIIPCILFSDVENCIAEIRKIYKKIKIIVCLNDSNFSTKKDKNLKFIITKSRAIGKKRNIATKYCKTKYIAFLDSDAYPKKGWIESTFNLLKNKNIGIIGGPHIDPINQNDEEGILELLAIDLFKREKNYEIVLLFSNNGIITLEAEVIEIELDNIENVND